MQQPPEDTSPPWYVTKYGPSFSCLLSGVLTSFVGHPVSLSLTGGLTVSGLCTGVQPGASVTLRGFTVDPPAAALLPPLLLPGPALLVVPFSCLCAARLPEAPSVPRALAEAARALQQRTVRSGGSRRGPRTSPDSATAAAAVGGEAAASSAVIGVSWALQGWVPDSALTL
jgi:hypothetical protein